MADIAIDGSFRTCSAPTEFSLLYDPAPFRANLAIQYFHSFPVRFGHDRNISLWIQGSDDEQEDYLKGLLAASIAIFCIFIVWALVLWVFKCLGPKRVGFFSARRLLPQMPTSPDILRQPHARKATLPFQSNGVTTTDRLASASSSSSPIRKKKTTLLQPVVKAPMMVARAPIRIASKAREKKRELELRHQFEKIHDSPGEGDDDNNNDEEEEEEEEHDNEDDKEEIEVLTQSGDDMSPAVLSDDDRKAIQEYEHARKDYEKQIYASRDRIRRIRIAAGLCACGALISSIMFTVMSERHLIHSFQKVERGLDQADAIVEDTLEVAEFYLARQASAKESLRKFLLQINGICPSVATSLCSNIDKDDAMSIEDLECDFTSVPFGSELTTVVTGYLATLSNIETNVGDVQSDLRETLGLLDTAHKYYPHTGVRIFWGAAGCSIALGFICMLLAGGILYLETTKKHGNERPLPRPFACTRSYVMIPLMLLLVIVSWILSMTFIFTGLASSDLCYNTPDEPVLKLLETKEDEFTSLVYSFARYYISGCPAVEAPLGMDNAIQSLQETVIPALVALSDVIQEQNTSEAECGTGFGALLAVLDAVGDQLCLLALTMADLRNLFQCEEWRPLYVVMMHEAVCDSATEGLVWAATTQLSLLIFSFFLLTLRVAYFETNEILEDPLNPSSGCCRCFRRKAPSDEAGVPNANKNDFKPSNEIQARWLPCCCCCDPVIPQGHIGEINMQKTMNAPTKFPSTHSSLPGMTPNVPVRSRASGSSDGRTIGSRRSGSQDSYDEEEIPLKN